MMILLLHLTQCTDSTWEENASTRNLLDRAFDLVGNRNEQGKLVAADVIAKSKGRSERASIVYCLLYKLRIRVWDRDNSHSLGLSCPLNDLRKAISGFQGPAISNLTACTDGGEPASFPVIDEGDSGSNTLMEDFDWNQWGDMVEEFLYSDAF